MAANPTTAVSKLAKALSLGNRFNLTDPTPWSSSRVYLPGNLATTTGGVWVCKTTTSPGDRPGSSSKWWQIVGPPAETAGSGGPSLTEVTYAAQSIAPGEPAVLCADGETRVVPWDSMEEGDTLLVLESPASLATADGNGGYVGRVNERTVTAAVDPTKRGGFDELGIWHDTDGKFARRGMSTAKALAVEFVRGVLAAAQAKDNPDGVMLKLRPDDSRLFDDFGAGPHRVRYRDDEFGVMDAVRGVLVRWDRFEEPDSDAPSLPDPEPVRGPRPPLSPLPRRSRADAEAERSRWSRVIGDMTHQGMSEESETADAARSRAASAISRDAAVAVADAAYKLPERARRAFGIPDASPDDLFPDGKLPEGVEFYLDYGVGLTPMRAPSIENTTAYRRAQAIADRGDRDTRGYDVWMQMAEEEAADLAERRNLIPESARITDRGSYVAKVGESIIASAFDGWGESSLNFKTVIAQRAIADAFGLPPAVDQRVNADVQADADSLYEAAPEGWQAYVRGVYAETQRLLADAGITEGVLFRGTRLPDSQRGVEPGLDELPPDGPASSWSVSPNVASVFGRDIRRSIVPAADILATPLSSGVGVSEEGEVVVLNRPRRTELLPRQRHGVPDGRMFDIWFDADQEDEAYRTLGAEFNDRAEPPVVAQRPTVDLAFVDDTSIPWGDRVDRLSAARTALAEQMGPPATWFHHPAPQTLTRIWNGEETPAERRALDQSAAIVEFGAAVTKLVDERADEIGATHRAYTDTAARVILDQIEAFAPGSTTGPLTRNMTQGGGQIGAWNGNDEAFTAWERVVEGIRSGTTEVVVKANGVVLIGRTETGQPIRAEVKKRDHMADTGTGITVRLPSGRNKYVREQYGHITVEVLGDRQTLNSPRAWTRGTGDFTELRAAVKAALDKSKKDSFDTLSNPPGVQAWTETMERMGIDMGTDPGILTSSGKAPVVERTIEMWGQTVTDKRSDPQAVADLPKVALGDLKASTAVAKTFNVGLAPYPRHWTSQLPPQHLDIATSTSTNLGSAYNSHLDNGAGNYVRVPSVVGNPQHATSVAHEFGHSMENGVPGVYLAEMWHLISRLSNHPGEQMSDVTRGRGRGFRDHFADSYSGRVYLDRPGRGEPPLSTRDGEMLPAARSFEILTTGVQTLYDRRGRDLDSDRELTAFALGAMALIGPPDAPDLADVADFNDRAEAPAVQPSRVIARFDGMSPAEPGATDAFGVRWPPAWTDVHVADRPEGVNGMLVRGRDAKGRQQYLYSAEHTERQAAAKWARLTAFADHLDQLDARLAADAPSNDTAAALALIRATGMRPGSTTDTRADKQAYGATTLLGSHVTLTDGTARFQFTGKKGVDIDISTDDPTVVAALTARADRIGTDEPLLATTAAQVNAYLDRTTRPEFKVKDLRTVKANVVAARLVAARPEPPESERERKRWINEVADEVAAALGNTRTVALASYINPVVFGPWQPGETAADLADGEVFTVGGIKIRKTGNGFVDDATGLPVQADGTPL